MDKYDIQKLRDLPIEGVAERLGLRVVKHRCICPYHDDHKPSFYFNIRRNTGCCFSCSTSGIGTIDLVMHMLRIPFLEACHWLADAHNVILTEYKPQTPKEHREPPTDTEWLQYLVAHPVLIAEAQHFLFDVRHISPDVVKWLGLSSLTQPAPCWRHGRAFYNAPSLLIPYRDIDGHLISVQARYLGQPSDHLPRFQFPRGAQCHIYNLPILRHLAQGEDLWIAEGCTDCMAMLSAGYKAIAIPSATLLNHNDMQLLSTSLSPTSRLHIYPDRDEAGEHLYTSLVRLANELKLCLVRHDLPDGCKDFSDYWVQMQS